MTTPPTDQGDGLERLTLAQLLDALGDKSPTPGGGAVASIITALGAALARMVVNYSVGKKKLAEHDGLHRESLDDLQALTSRALQLAGEDERAYGRLNELMKLDPDDARRKAQWAEAVEQALAAPQAILEASLTLMNLLERLTDATNRMLVSDLAIAAILAEAGAKAAAWNIQVNLSLVEDQTQRLAIGSETDLMLTNAARLRDRIESACRNEA